jgi:hypothetical protein
MGFSPWTSGSTLNGRSAFVHEDVTSSHIEAWILKNVLSVEEVEVTVNIGDNQKIVDATDSGSGSRYLQVTERSLFVRCDISLIYKSTAEENDTENWVYSAFEDGTDEQGYIASLQRRSDVFQGVEHVAVEVDGYYPPPSTATTTKAAPKNDSNVAVIAGAAVGGAALILLAVFLFMRKPGGTKSTEEVNYQSNSTPETTGQAKIGVSTYVPLGPYVSETLWSLQHANFLYRFLEKSLWNHRMMSVRLAIQCLVKVECLWRALKRMR